MQNTLGVTERDQRLRPALCQWSTQDSAVALWPRRPRYGTMRRLSLALAEYHLPSSADDIGQDQLRRGWRLKRPPEEPCEEHCFHGSSVPETKAFASGHGATAGE